MIDDEHKPLPVKRGRPSRYTKKIAAEICRRLASGESLLTICADDGMPAAVTVRGWVIDNREGFSAQYGRARDMQADHYVDETVQIADTETDAQKARVRIDARKWYASKVRPKAYGDAVQMKHSGAIGTFDPSKLSSDALNTLVSVLESSAAGGGDAEDGEGGADEADG